MRLDQLADLLGSRPWFDLATVVQLSGEARRDVVNQLYRWSRAGKLIPVRRGMYTLADRYRHVPVAPATLANALCFPSYLSGLWALSFYGLIPEAVPVHTSVTTRSPADYENACGMFHYTAIKRSFFFGYHTVSVAGTEALVATAEKALLDLFHLHTGEWDRDQMTEMRFQQTEVVDRDRLHAYTRRIGKPRIGRAVDVWLACSAEQEAGSRTVKDQALARALQFDVPQRRLNALREYLQAFIMRSLHESEAARAVAFVGGTALRFIEGLPRLSEDLDFSRVSAEGYEPVRWLEKLKRDLYFAGFDSAIRWIEREPVQVAWVRTARLLADAGLSGHAQQNLSVKVEIDTRPPAGATISHFSFVISHYDLPSLMAGKLHALLTRGYPKGRDWYDLIWYRSRRPPVEPNGQLLQHALDQTQGAGRYRAADWRTLLAARLADLDTRGLARDVRPFLERPEDAALLDRANLEASLAR